MVGKKAESISINVIIIAIIALLVLVVLMAIFGGQMGLWNKNVDNIKDPVCMGDGKNAQGGEVVAFEDECPADMKWLPGKFTDVSMGSKCCVPSKTP